MPVGATVDVLQEPFTILTEWRVYLVKADFNTHADTIHFIGFNGYEGRVCSPVVEYDSVQRRAITKSGRRYKLEGPSGYSGDAMYVWNEWLKMLGSNCKFKDITDQYE